jgi:hypothetical protein
MLHVIHKCHMRLPDVTSRLSPLGRRRPFLLHSSPQHVAGVEGMTWLKYVEIIGKKKHSYVTVKSLVVVKVYLFWWLLSVSCFAFLTSAGCDTQKSSGNGPRVSKLGTAKTSAFHSRRVAAKVNWSCIVEELKRWSGMSSVNNDRFPID